MISLETASQLLDFRGGTDGRAARLSEERAREQLEGAVALHNLLERQSFAYLADEVGLGKTYVALGAFALFRHFDPHFRLLVIAPKKNIQEKWIKELRNFTRNNVRFPDLRVKAVHAAPSRSPVHCENLFELVRETSLDPDRDFFVRLTSFGFGLAEESEGWTKKRDAIRSLLPWIREDVFDLRSKERFKENYARAVCCAIPEFDLVIVDEGHNLKHGLHRAAARRNHLTALVFGNDRNGANADRRRFPGYGPRAKRVLFLSATPVEDDYRHIWNQMDVFGLAGPVDLLNDPETSEEKKRERVQSFLIRRVSAVRTGELGLTKNLYRREWRGGGVQNHDLPLPLPDDRQRLLVALVQKKVSELLEDERFGHAFQIGMLASFESFMRTAKANADGGPFDDGEQTDDVIEREGLDVNAVNRLTDSYRRVFGVPMPHPKMDALADSLRSAFDSGRKALVFVRRVASVKELKQKLDSAYDEWLFARLRNELRPDLREPLEKIIAMYHEERRRRRSSDVDRPAAFEDADPSTDVTEDSGGIDTFFAWFFRGDGPPGVLSGASVAQRFTRTQYALSSFFSDNYAADLLGTTPGSVFEALRDYTGWPASELREQLERRASEMLGQRRRGHFDLFSAFQYAALSILHEVSGDLKDRATVVLHELFPVPGREKGRPALGTWLETSTFFTHLRRHERLRDALWPVDSAGEFAPAFRRRELRRELLTAMTRRGHAFIDLYILIANQLGRLHARGARDDQDLDNGRLAEEFLALLSGQRERREFRAYQELHEAATNFDLIVDTNAPALWEAERRLDEVPREIGRLLRAQQPVGGMFGEVSKTLVSQFRMPGYPFILITTDLLQEGEDLHLFCSDVYHYGISWMPSSMEQRIGRIDRVRCQTERRLGALAQEPSGDDLLQVYYPYLRETVEVYQVNRVLERMNRFLRLMHESVGTPDDGGERKINLLEEVQNAVRASPVSREPLKSSFPVDKRLLSGPRRPLAVSQRLATELIERFRNIQNALFRNGVTWESVTSDHARIGNRCVGNRQQTFTLFLHTIGGVANVRCVSPIGRVDVSAETERISIAAREMRVRVCAVYDSRFQHYNLTAEHDVLLGAEEYDARRVAWLVHTTVNAADELEAILLETDAAPAGFREDLAQEPHFER